MLPDDPHYIDTPTYSAEPSIDERVLERTQTLERTVPTGTYTCSNEHFQLTLREQQSHAKLPSYGRHGHIKGELSLKDLEEIVSVDIKVHVLHIHIMPPNTPFILSPSLKESLI